MTLTVGSLFSGIGGLDLGLERAGMTVKWQAEIDPYCSRVLAKHWPNVSNLGDVTKIDWSEVERVELVCGGFPCQPWSVAGRRLGTADERWLWPEFARAVRDVRPRFVLVENVPGLLVGGLGDVLGDLAALGFDAEWESIPAAAVGAPHLRYRVFIVAYPNGEGLRKQPVAISRRIGSAVIGPDGSTRTVADADCARSQGVRVFGAAPERGGRWAIEPDVGRVADGVPCRVDRLRSLGNAVVPQVAEYIGTQLLAAVREAV